MSEYPHRSRQGRLRPLTAEDRQRKYERNVRRGRRAERVQRVHSRGPASAPHLPAEALERARAKYDGVERGRAESVRGVLDRVLPWRRRRRETAR